MRDEEHLDVWLAGARSSIESSIERSLQSRPGEGVADFTAVVEEIHRRDPSRVDEGGLAQVMAMSPAMALVESPPDEQDPRFDALLAGARASIAADVAARLQRGIPSPMMPRGGAVAAAAARRRRWSGIVAMAAALGLLFLGTRELIVASQRGPETAPGEAVYGARLGEGGAASDHVAIDRRRHPSRAATAADEAPGTDEPVASPEASEDELASAEPATSKEDSQGPQATKGADRRPSTVHRGTHVATPSLDDRLRALDTEAQRSLRSGDVRGAERRFHEIIELGAGTRYADLAFGDLFTLARQQDGAAREAELWREYLRAFPGGRYADDATAGLCRRTAEEQQSRCWREYLVQFPEGVYSARARSLASEEAP